MTPRGPRRTGWGWTALPAASAVLIALAAPPFDVDWLAWIALVPLLAATARARGASEGSLCGALAGLTLALAIDHGLWAFDGRLFLYATVVVVVVLAGVTGAVASLRAATVASPVFRLLLFPALWVLGEWTCIELGVPWSLALTQASNLAVIQGASVLGMLAISFLIVVVNGALFDALQTLHARRGLRQAAANLAAATLLLGVDLGYGCWYVSRDPPAGAPVHVATVQPVLSTEQYRYSGLDPSLRRFLVDVFDRLTRQAIARGSDLVVWSEGGNGLFNFRLPAARHAIDDWLRGSGATLLAASNDLDEAGRTTNSVFAVSPDGVLLGRYDKVWLTPAGEEQFTRGVRTDPLPTPHGLVGTLICFESCFPGPARALVRAGATMLVTTTSDAAFRRSSLPALHGLFGVFRAVENRRPFVQAGNTGPSFVVDARGAVTSRLPFYRRGVLEGVVTPQSRQSVYTSVGDLPLLALLVAVVAGAGLSARRTRDVDALRPPIGRAWLVAGLVATAGGLAVAVASLWGVSERGGEHASLDAAIRSFVASPPPVVSADAAVPFLQSGRNTCGIAGLAYLLGHLGVPVREADLLPQTEPAEAGVTMAQLVRLASAQGFDAWGEHQNLAALRLTPKPVIVHVEGDHYLVVVSMGRDDVDVFDPARGYRRLPLDEFQAEWQGNVLIVRFRSTPELNALTSKIP